MRQRIEEQTRKAGYPGRDVKKSTVRVPARISTSDQLEELIRQLQELKQAAYYFAIEVSFVIEDDG